MMGIPKAQLERMLGRKLNEPAKKIDKQKSKYRSKSEAAYAMRLEAMKRTGEIHNWRYEAVTFTIGVTETGKPWKYKPDFMVLADPRTFRWWIEFHEVKGWHRGRERGLAKFRAAKALFPWFKWVLIEKVQ